jgi:hypothetical protein
MAIGGKYSQFESRYKDSIKKLSNSIQYRTERITTILLKAYNKPKPGARYWNAVRAELDIQYRELQSLYNTWARKAIPISYRASVKELMTRLNRSKTIAARATVSYSTLVNNTRSQQIVNALFRDAVTDWVGALNAGQANLNRLTRRTQQLLIQESFVDISVANAIESGNLMNNTFVSTLPVTDTLSDQLIAASKMIDGELYVQAGSKRFTPNYYAEMVTRTKFHEAQAFGAIQTARNYKTSLVHVSAHNTTTAICQLFEGKVFSIGGQDPRFPRLETAPPFHPNCLHLLFPVFSSAMEVTGTLEDWEKFSKGESNRPPAPANFVPVSDRGEV